MKNGITLKYNKESFLISVLKFIIYFQFEFWIDLIWTNYTVNASPCSFHIGSGLKKIMIVGLFSSVY